MSQPMRRVHFLGICGTAMATLAALLKARGDHVQGSDAHVYPPMSDFLAREGEAMTGYLSELNEHGPYKAKDAAKAASFEGQET